MPVYILALVDTTYIHPFDVNITVLFKADRTPIIIIEIEVYLINLFITYLTIFIHCCSYCSSFALIKVLTTQSLLRAGTIKTGLSLALMNNLVMILLVK